MAMLDIWSQYPDYDGYRYSDEYYTDKIEEVDLADRTEDDVAF